MASHLVHCAAPNAAELEWFKAAAPSSFAEPYAMWPDLELGFNQVSLHSHGPVIDQPDGSQVDITATCSWIEAGIPMRSLRGQWFDVPDTSTGRWQSHARGASKVRNQTLNAMFPHRAVYLPWFPRWPGFAINTIFYAAILWLIFAFPFVLRRRQRNKRGLCPACAYPIGTNSRCTECGKPVVARGA